MIHVPPQMEDGNFFINGFVWGFFAGGMFTVLLAILMVRYEDHINMVMNTFR